MESFKAQFEQRLSERSSSHPPPVVQTLQIHWQQFNGMNPDFDFTVQKPEFIDALITCWTGSDFAAEQCIRYPEHLEYLHNLPATIHNFTTHHQQQLSAALAEITTENQLMQILRRYRNREMLRIIWLDLNRRISMPTTTADLSAMADQCVQQALEWLTEDLQKTLGTPFGAAYGEKPEPQKMVVLGMGKLGANELNLSSDIDLMFTYPHQGETLGGRRSITNQEFFIRLGQRLIKVLDSQTIDGFVFRIDMRLRPYGTSGALAMSFSAMEQYYQDQGRDWERYAMIKARAIAGDLPAGRQLLQQLHPFVYRRYIDFGSISALRDMKRMIQREVNRKGMGNNIKLGPGGIREIEFIAQSFQLIHGGRDRSLQQRSLQNILKLLKAGNYLPAVAVTELDDAYVFLRNLEHAIQAIADRQTQDLPGDSITRSRIAMSMGHQDWDDLQNTLENHKAKVVKHFEAVITDSDDSDQSEDENDHWHAFWQSRLTENEELKLLADAGFPEPAISRQQVLSLRDGKSITRVRRQSRERLDRFIPILLKTIAESSSQDVALNRLLPLVEAVLRRTAYLVLLMENSAALEHLIKLCIASPWIADQIAKNPVLLDEFLNLGDLYDPPQKDQLADELRQQLAHIPEDDLESQMDVLRYFKMSHVLRVAAAQVSGTLPLMKESDYLTWIAEVVLKQVVAIAWHNMTERHGYPQNNEGELCDPGFIIIGYGKLGGIELGPGSDLDLVFVHDGAINKETDGARPIDSSTFYARLGQRIIHILHTQTTSGILYETDMRLRPSGSSGLLVSSFTAFEKYQQDDAWTWEHQALVRARVVAGDSALAEKFVEVRKKVLSRKRDPELLRHDVINMRQKMREHLGSKSNNDELFNLKHDSGGIVDIEFLMQYAVLNCACDYDDLSKWTDNVRISEELEKAGLISSEDAYWLMEAYKTFRMGIHQKALQNEPPLADEKMAKEYRERVTNVWQLLIGA